jgi:hypothetical protein
MSLTHHGDQSLNHVGARLVTGHRPLLGSANGENSRHQVDQGLESLL